MPSIPPMSSHLPQKTSKLKNHPLLVVGLTGGIGSGKSTVSRLLKQAGAKLIEADLLGHKLMQPAGVAVASIIKTFGEQMVDSKGGINRVELARVAFAHPQQLAKLNAILHPFIMKEIQQRLRQLRALKQTAPPLPIVIEAALLLEANWEHLCDVIWVLDTPKEIALERALQLGRWTLADFTKRMKYQMNSAERLARAHYILPNSQDIPTLKVVVQKQWQAILDQAKLDYAL